MSAVSAAHGKRILDHLAQTIHANAAYLSQLDGAVGDGDHGINMDKGFSKARERIGEHTSLSEALRTLGNTLLGEIGGAMGPLYGSFFSGDGFGLRRQDRDRRQHFRRHAGGRAGRHSKT